jgi:hypothetical protein
MIESNPEYKGRTTMLILPDFGRDSDFSPSGNGFQHHRTGDPLSRTTWMMAMGPHIRQNRTVDRALDSDDLVPTLGAMMNFPPRWPKEDQYWRCFDRPGRVASGELRAVSAAGAFVRGGKSACVATNAFDINRDCTATGDPVRLVLSCRREQLSRQLDLVGWMDAASFVALMAPLSAIQLSPELRGID